MDQIKIENLEIFANHGVYPEENRLGQKFLVSCILYVDTRKAGKTDDLEASAGRTAEGWIHSSVRRRISCEIYTGS